MLDYIKKIALTETQKGIYFDCQLDDPIAYHVSATFLLEDLNEKHFENAFKLLIAEQEALRSCIEIIDDSPILVIHEQTEFVLEIQDISHDPLNQQEHIKSIVEEEIKCQFELTKSPLFRCKLLKLNNNMSLFLICIHHLISDGTSLNILMNKLRIFYHKLLKRDVIVLKKDSGFFNYIEQENNNLKFNKISQEKEFWANKMKGMKPLKLQADYTVKQKSGMGKEKRFAIPLELVQSIQSVSKNQEITIFTFFLSVFSLLISHYVQSEEIVINSPFSYRPDINLEETIGCFIRMLPLRFNIDKSECFSAILKQVFKEFVAAYKNIKYPNNLIMRDNFSSLPMGSTTSIFDVIYVYNVYEEVGEETLVAKLIDQDVVTFPGSLMVALNKTPSQYLIKIQYKADVFSDETIELLGSRYLILLNALVENVNIKIKDICLFLDNEKEQLINEFNRSTYFNYHPQNLIDLFSAKVQEQPDQIALIQGEKRETYAQVNAKVNQLAYRILKQKSKVNECIGVQLERSIDLIISILAILKAGCAYVAIEPTYPKSRKEFIFKDAEITLLITSSHLPCEYNHDLQFLFIDDSKIYQDVKELSLEISNPYSLAYIAYTSGSTGNPKGVMIENHSVVNTLLDLERRFPLNKQDVFLFKTPYSFDLSVSEIFGWFVGGGALCILEPGGEANPQLILDEIAKHHITHVNFVPSMFRLFLELFDSRSNIAKINSLKWIFIGGEKVTTDILEKFNMLNTHIKLECMYGPTECTLWATNYSINDFSKNSNIPIGRPLNEIRCYIVGKNNQLQPIGIAGELCLSGVGLARGYMNLQKMTEEKFVINPFFQEGIDPEHYRKMYRTGDLVRWLPCGNLDFLGRIDFQVKMRGLRLELEEIENVLAEYPGIIQAVAVVKKEVNKADILCAYYLSESEISESKLKAYLAKILPIYMVPSLFFHKKEWPLTNSGKVDRKLLSADISYQRKISSAPIEPQTELERTISNIWKEVLSINHVGLDDNFFEVGGHSLSLIQLNNKIKKHLNIDIPLNVHFQFPTIRLLAEHFSKNLMKAVIDRKTLFKYNEKIIYKDIAIIGMSVNVPGSENINDFWNNLIHEKESLYFYQDDELRKLGIPSETLNNPHYVKVRGRIEGIEYFDSTFFDYTPAEVNLMSPQMRLLYQGIWKAFEDAGYFPNSDSSTIGLFLGGSDEFEWYKKVLFNDSNFVDRYQAFTLSSNHFLATRLAYKLNIKGPVFSAQTACSTSLATTHLACQSLILGESDLAIAGGITVRLPNEGGYFYQPGMMFSPDGHCRPFDAKAEGAIFSNGFGLVVLKRLDEALKDGDHIYAVIKGSAVNNDGEQKLGFTAPSVKGQSEAMQAAYCAARIDPETISYIEAHGTGTLLGDPVEVESLTQAFATSKKEFCILGSIKGNIGHTDTAAGIVSLLKVALSVKHKYIPGTVNYEKSNPKINFSDTPFTVKSKGEKWVKNNEREILRAGINAFGVGGTNVHMVLEEVPKSEKSNSASPINLLVFSAKSITALSETSKVVLEYLYKNPEINLSNAAWTLQVGRKPFNYRKSLVIDEKFYQTPFDTMLKQLNQVDVQELTPKKRKVYFMFSGQGSQYAGMARDLYYSQDKSALSIIFREYIDQVFDVLPKAERNNFLDIIFDQENTQKINETQFSQFALFAISYALARTMIKLGINPDGLIGHSVGEITAATIAGVFELKDAVEIVLKRGRIMQKQAPGVLLSVMADAHQVEKELGVDVWLALDNTSNSCVVGGSAIAIADFEKKAEKFGWTTLKVKTSHAFHTPMMKQAASAFQKILVAYKLNEPQIPIVSNLTGTWVIKNQMSSPKYWAEHILKPVNFTKSLAELLKDEDSIFIELGPNNILCSLANTHVSKKKEHHFINLIRHPKIVEDDVKFINQKLGQIWCLGIDIDWHKLKGDTLRNRLSLPTYIFDKEYFPLDVSIESYPAIADVDTTFTAATEKLDRVETIIINAYKSVLGFKAIDLHQDFFELGGDSLRAVSLSATISSELAIKIDVKDIFQNPTPFALIDYINKSSHKKASDPEITPVTIRDYYPLSSAQSRMYTLYLLDRNSVAYNLPSATIITGQLNKERFVDALNKLIARHEALRTLFTVRENQLVQVITKEYRIPITYSERLSPNQDEMTQLIYSFIKPFDFEQGPPFRAELINIGSNTHLFLFDIHHIIADGTSMEIIIRDFNQLYFKELPLLKIHYKDYAVWQNNLSQQETLKEQENYWLNTLSDELPILELPTDFKRPSVKSFDGDRVYFTLDKLLTEQLTHFSRETGTTLFMLLLSMWNVFIARYSNQEDVIVGVPISGRTHKEIEETVGMFVNMLPMRNHPANKKKFTDFLTEVKVNALNAFNNQGYQFDNLIKKLNLKRDTTRNPLFEVCFNFENMKFYELEIEDIHFTPYTFGSNSSVYDLTLTLSENSKKCVIEGYIEYATRLFKRETIERMVENFQKMLMSILEDKGILIEQINIVSSNEQQLLCGKFNETSLSFNDNLLIQNLFEQNVNNFPNKVALVTSNGKSLTYSELNEKANALAWHLIEQGLKKEAIVGVMTNRDESLLITLLGILKAGGAYLPIDPAYPAERISYMLSCCNVDFLICSGQYRNKIDFNGYIINLNDNQLIQNNLNLKLQDPVGTQLSYVIFTSGSTGKPKGVMIQHASIINLIHEVKNKGFFQNPEDRMICMTTMSFDIFAFEAIIPLCIGSSVYLADEAEQLDPMLANKKIIQHKVTHLFSTVSRLKVFVESPEFQPALRQLKYIFSGGEHFPIQLLKYLQSCTQAKIYNMYGPTEVTIWSTLKDLTHADEINVGQPIANTQAYVINSAGKLQPIGVFGELCLAGNGLARGYLNNAKETQEKFVHLPDIASTLIYKTGDRARLLANGELEISGRFDTQEKVRGYRIELNEIEEIVLQHPHIHQAAVNIFEDNNQNKQLVLYYCLKREHDAYGQDYAWLKRWLEEKLAYYMMPASFIVLDKMPLLPNGKINRKALCLPIMKNPIAIESVDTLNDLENTLLSFWQEQLNLENINIKDNFFDLGGNSLGLIYINNKINKYLGHPIPLLQLFEYPTIESLAKRLMVSYKEKDLTNVLPVEKYKSTDIAVIGLSCKFPGADNIPEFWHNIITGSETISQFNDEELLNNGIDPTLLANPHYKKVKGYLPDVEYFDAEFFNYTHQEANVMDPQIRILHQCTWEVLEDAGYDSTTYAGKIGFYAGSSSNILWIKQLINDQHDFLNSFELITLNEKDFLTTRLSYKLNLKGPSLSIHTACSTSLVAIHQATQSLINGESDMAVAGGVSISYPRKDGYLWHEGMIFSQDGHCRPFSEDASGIIPGNGCGLVLLKRLDDAIRDQDHIYAVIKGTAINNDGNEKVGYTAPSINGQRSVIETALEKSGILAEELSYLEAHGTGTKIGDPIEIEALKTAWKTNKKNFCAIGSVKANIGHLDAAAGVASFIKTTLLVHHRTIPPQINFKNPNPLIDFKDSPFYINTEAKTVTDHTIIRAGISSFGIGGTNAHIILEQSPPIVTSNDVDAVNLLLFSARSLSALAKTSTRILDYLQQNTSINLSDVAWTLQVGRKAFEYRKVLIIVGPLNQNKKNLVEFINSPGSKVSDIKKSHLIHLEQRFAELLSARNQMNPVDFNKKIGELWCEGLDIDWKKLHDNPMRKCISLPTYVFDKKHHINDLNLKDMFSKPTAIESTVANTDIRNCLNNIWSKIFGCDIREQDDFFVLGGDSLKAVYLAAQIQKIIKIKISLADIFNHSVFNQMVNCLDSYSAHQELYKIQPIQEQPYYETSSAQKRQYILHELLGNAVPYNLGAVYWVEGVVVRDRFKKIVDDLMERHESFRTKFCVVNDKIVQIVEKEVKPIIEFDYATESEIENKIAEFIKPFDLSKAPLFKVKLITLHDQKHILLIDMHHIIADQSSVSILVKEFTELYSGKVLSPLTIQYKDFAAWQNTLFDKDEIENQIEYWRNEFKGEIPILNMPADFPRPLNQTFEGERIIFKLDENINNKINALTKRYALTPFMIFMAAFKLVLWKYSDQNDLVVGTAISGRRHADLNSIVGMFANTLAIRTQVNEQITLEEYLRYIKEKVIKAYDNQECQFEHLIELLNIEKDPSRNPLFDVAINYTDIANTELCLDGLSIKPWSNNKIYSKFDIVWNIEKKEHSYVSDIEYNSCIYKRETIDALSNRLLQILLIMLEQPQLELNKLSLLSTDEKKYVLNELNQTTTQYPKHLTLFQLFEEQVSKHGHRTALVFNGEAWSYSQLNNEVNRIAQILVKYGVMPGDHIAILLDRCPLQIACILGILKLGCAYVPIDPDYPIERIHFILEDSGANALLTYSQYNISTPVQKVLLDIEEKVLQIDANRSAVISSEDTAYIIYTSGSTGKPKGVLTSHRNVIRLVKETNYIEIQPEDKLLRLLNYAFDGSVFDIFGALLNGACLVIVPKETTLEMSLLTELIKRQGITILCITTAQFNMLVDWDVTSLVNVRKILFAGEAASLSHTRKALMVLGPNKLIHGYGPTEATVLATYYPVDRLDQNISAIPIGYPISNTKLYILDKHLQPVPYNIPGELYIGGDAVAKGYLNQEQLTQQNFLNDPFDSQGRIYRTGDIVRRLPSNEIVFIGRRDSQIKIRGYRVELGEIEHQINAIPGIKDVVVIAKKNQHDSFIAAYYTVTHGEISADEIRKLISDKMPEYMIPSYMIIMKSLPLDANGKIDHKNLPHINRTQSYLQIARNKAEEIILNETRSILNNNIGVTDDFFKFGGHSLKAVALAHALLKRGVKLTISEIFQHRTVENLAKLPQFILFNKEEIKSTFVQPIAWNEEQIKSLFDYFVSTSNLFSKILIFASEINSFPLSPLQMLHTKQATMLSGFTTDIEGDIHEIDIRKQIAKIIQNNQLLHSVIQRGDSPVWKEYDISTLIPMVERSISYLDLRDLDGKTKERILNEISTYILTTPYQEESFLWRLCCLRLNQQHHVVIWGFDHISFDGMSAEVLQNQILKGTQDVQKYQDYVLQLKKGPQNITECEIIDAFSLNKWQASNAALMQKLVQLQNTNQKEINITIPFRESDIKDPWSLSFEIVVKVLREYFGINEIPLAIVHYGRNYQHQNYYNCLGEFLDVIPVLVKQIGKETDFIGLLKKCQENAINFISLLIDQDLSNKYPKITECLKSAYKTDGEAQQLVLFNFQGFLSNKDQNIFENALKVIDKKHLSKINVTVNYNEDSINITMGCLDGFIMNRIEKIVDTHTKKCRKINFELLEY